MLGKGSGSKRGIGKGRWELRSRGREAFLRNSGHETVFGYFITNEPRIFKCRNLPQLILLENGSLWTQHFRLYV